MTQTIDRSISVGRAYVLMMRLLVPLLMVLVVIACRLGGTGLMGEMLLGLGSPLRLLGLMVLGVILHELIHGLTWALLGGKPLSTLKFGFQWKTLTPYAHMRDPITLHAYRWGAVMPAILLGFIPYGIGLLIGAPFWILYGWLFVLAAGGDFVIVWLLRSEREDVLVQDHPSRVGCLVLEGDTD